MYYRTEFFVYKNVFLILICLIYREYMHFTKGLNYNTLKVEFLNTSVTFSNRILIAIKPSCNYKN